MDGAAAEGGRGAAPLVVRTLGAPPAAGAAAWATRRRLRVLGYHDVPDPDAFAAHVAEIADRWHPVSGAQVAAALAGGEPLPERAVWITFDDGRPGVVANALPALADHGVSATAFVCPAVLADEGPLWWQVLDARPDVEVEVDGRSLGGRALVRALKRVPDHQRRAVVAEVAAAPASRPEPPRLTRADLSRWSDAGMEVGNHTWDHPILDRCTPDEQAAQVERAHDWLAAELGAPPTLFAYPNGDHTAHVAGVLDRLGYGVAPLYDHHLVARSPDPLALSRLRIDADAPLARLRAVLGGAHSGIFGLAARARRTRADAA